MQRTPGQRDYGSSDSARLRSLASRGVATPVAARSPADASTVEGKPGARPEAGRKAARQPTRDTRLPA